MRDRRISDACRELVHNLCILESKTKRKTPRQLFSRMYQELERNRFYRLMSCKAFEDDSVSDDGDDMLWRLDEVKMLCSMVPSIRPFDPAEVYDHLVDPDIVTNSTLVNLIRPTYFRETKDSLPQLNRILQKYMAGARKIVACQYLIAARHQNEGFVEADVQRQQDEQGFGPDMFKQKAQFQLDCIEKFDNYDPGRTDTTIGQFHSGMDEIRNCKKRFRYLKPEDAEEVQEGLAYDAIDAKGHKIIEINDSSAVLTAEQARWISTFEVFVVGDDNFAMKMCKGGIRKFLKRTGDPQRDRLLDHELSLLYQLFSSGHIMHGKDKADMIKHWTNGATEAQRREEEKSRINQEAIEDMKKQPAPSAENERVRMPKKFWLPN